MTYASQRVLIVDDEQALLFALSEYLTFRGCRVDGVEWVVDARALLQHLHYDAVVVGVNPTNLAASRAVAAEARARLPRARLIALAHEAAEGSLSADECSGFDHVFARHLPTVQLARVLCHSIAA